MKNYAQRYLSCHLTYISVEHSEGDEMLAHYVTVHRGNYYGEM